LNKLCLLATGLLLSLSLVCHGQVDQIGRFELPITEEGDPFYSVVSAHTDGLVIFRKLLGKGTDEMQVIRLDTSLNEIWRGFVSLEKDLSLRYARTYQNNLYVLLKNLTWANANFTLIQLDLITKSYTLYNIKNYISFNPTDFVATNDAIMIGGYYNYRPLVLHFSLLSRQSKILPGSFNEPGELLQIKPYENGMIDVIVSAKNLSGKKCLWIRNYDLDGTLVKTILLEPDPDKNLIFGRSVKMPNDEQVVAGVYGRTTEFSRGLFVAHINSFGEYKINYYNFGDLQNFFKFMKARRQKRIQDRIVRRKIKGKKIKFNYRFLVHELVPYGDQYIMLGEAFYPKYKSVSPYGGMVGYSPYSSTRSNWVFDGYQYTHAVVIGLSKSGKLIWDNSFEINDAKSFSLEQFVKIQPSEDHISLLYLFDNVIRSKIIKDSQVLEGKTTESIRTEFATDRVQEDAHAVSKLEYWYPGRFYAYGTQTIDNELTPGVANNRRVFFINKITSK
jgi:hypothetical protein